MEILLIALVLLFLFGSLQWAMPSRRERRTARLRQIALVEGMQIRLGKSDDPARVCYYLAGSFIGCALRRTAEAGQGTGDAIQTMPGWSHEPAGEARLSAAQQAALARCTERLPESVLYIRATRVALELWWDEQAEPETIHEIAAIAREMAEQLELEMGR